MFSGNVQTPINTAPSIEAGVDGGGSSASGAVVDDRALLTSLRAGHEWAFETMVRLYGGRLLAVARRFTRNDEDAKDVLQSAYLSAFLALNDFEGACQLSTWLHRIVVNTALMKLRSRRRKPEESIEELLPRFDAQGEWTSRVTSWE